MKGNTFEEAASVVSHLRIDINAWMSVYAISALLVLAVKNYL